MVMSEKTQSAISPAHLQQLADNGYVVVDNFLSPELQDDLRKDVFELRSLSKFKLARIGHDGMVQDENTPFRDIRYSETCFIGRTNEPEPRCKARQNLYAILENLKQELDTNAVVKGGAVTRTLPPLDADMEELMYAYYPKGGYYRRHKDADPDTVSTVRKYSLLVYLNKDWTPKDGGELRIHCDSGGDKLPVDELPNFIDVAPKSGTLIVFRSDMVPHEVLDTQKERLAIVGWFLSDAPTDPQRDTDVGATVVVPTKAMEPETLKMLRAMRDASPRLAAKLKPAPPADHSGMIGGDFFFPGLVAPATEQVEVFEDTDPRYWKKIATFGPSGHISTLSLGGNRLRHLMNEIWCPAFLGHVVTLDLANTDLSVEATLAIVQKCNPDTLRHLHLGGNGIRGQDVQTLQSAAGRMLKHLVTLDLRYNCIGHLGMSLLSEALQQEDCHWSILYLEGNELTDASLSQLSSLGQLTQLYLGQNKIGPDGAAILAAALQHENRLKKLYLESNAIGNEGARALYTVLEAMQETKTLEKLYAENNGINKDESIRLGRSLNSATFMGEGGLFQD